ncbi:hypothetical protein [Xylophilus sp.]|uniref:hypothetical protein n=1 Tax=Xylophilus sp. TaxID=2653893 RepID=UPI0013B704E2|nr:hypothetical protein [Xylophilus sp.]KAF1048192.1 MAG: hypothetical protein GAK38_01440 [Xylophilus sp.]
MFKVIAESELDGIWPSHFHEALLVTRSRFDQGVPVWGAPAPGHVEGACLLIVVEDPNDEATIARVKRALLARHRATPLIERRD